MNAKDFSWAPLVDEASTSAPAGRAPTDESLANLAEVALLTKDGADFRRIWVAAAAGVVILRGKVGTKSEKSEAASVVRKVDGVHDVNNQLEVAPESVSWRAMRP